MYQGSVTSHVDIIPALCHVLEQVELNRFADMMWFSRRIWPSLVALMKGRMRTDYIHLLVIFKYILPYYTRVENDDEKEEVITNLVDSNSYKGLTDLVLVIDEHAPLKAGLEPLSMESLRLEFTPPDEDLFTGFRTKTFRHGRAFTASQAHTWAMLELQADCIFYVGFNLLVNDVPDGLICSYTVKRKLPLIHSSIMKVVLPSEGDRKMLWKCWLMGSKTIIYQRKDSSACRCFCF